MDYSPILHSFDLDFMKAVPEIPLIGSPERCAFRIVVETRDKKRYVLERVFDATVNRKEAIAGRLSRLKDGGLDAIHPYLRTTLGNHLVESGGAYWQIMPFIEGIPLHRPGYAEDAWRGVVLARFLIDLKKAGKDTGGVFSLPSYIISLFDALKKHQPESFRRFSPFRDTIDMNLFNSLPSGFCHGDFHPLNIIWGEDRINSVIDWEFCGMKPELYDAANLVGCVGIEDPMFLLEGLVPAFISSLREDGFGSEKSWASFPELVYATRFGWVSEWARKNDTEMLDLEVAYLKLLGKHRNSLRKMWKIPV